MKHYYIIEENYGEEFLVGADSLEEALEIAKEVYGEEDEPTKFHYVCTMTDWEAENSGLDEY